MNYVTRLTLESSRRVTSLLAVMLFLLVSSGCSLTTEQKPLEVTTVPPLVENTPVEEISHITGSLKVLSLNMAHSRKDGTNQLFLSKKTIHNNLDDIVVLLEQNQPDLVALQEADGPSRWSGNFDHVAKLAEQAQYPWYSRATHAKGWLYNYGTALLSRSAFTDVVGHAFEPTPPTLTKGFLLAQIKWRPNAHENAVILVDVISVHLDFSRRNVRERQIKEMTEVLSGRNNPVIILGDFNSDWFSEQAVIKKLAAQSRLQAYKPEATDLGTYNSSGRRLDWILISNELEFKNYVVLADVVSDHAAVVAEIGLKKPSM